MSQTEKEESLAKQIQAAKQAVSEWPNWMKDLAYVSSTELSSASARKVFEETTQQSNVTGGGEQEKKK